MNENKYLVLIKNEDVTSKIYGYSETSSYIVVTYKKSGKTYRYSKVNVKIIDNPAEIEIDDFDFKIGNEKLYDMVKVLKFGSLYKLFFPRKKTLIVEMEKLSITPKSESDRDVQSTNKWEYLRKVSEIVSIKTDDESLILTQEFDKINHLDESTALYKYLHSAEKIDEYKSSSVYIYPFGTNLSQMNAVKNAMENQISVIEGPPGTGKTQTILNIIANIIVQGKTVAVVSNNNSATDNVYEKLKEYGLDYLCAPLGRKENKEKFIEKQKNEIPEFEQEVENIEYCKSKIKKATNDIINLFEYERKNAALKEKLSKLKVERTYYENQNKEVEIPKIRKFLDLSSDDIMDLIMQEEHINSYNKILLVINRIKAYFVYGVGTLEFYLQSVGNILQAYNKLYYVLKEREIENEIKRNNWKIKNIGENKLQELSQLSNGYLNEMLRQKYQGKINRRIFEIEELYKNPKLFNEEYPIILSTTYSIKNCLGKSHVYDYVIIDESSQVDLVTGMIAMSSAKNVVVVGDLKQLPNVITSGDRELIDKLAIRYLIDDKYSYLNNSLLSSITKAIVNVPRVILREHYRCHPKIIEFCNNKFYNNQLIIMTEDKGEKDVLKTYITVEGNHARGKVNRRQIDVIEGEILPDLKNNNNIDEKNIGIVSPYRGQKFAISKKVDSTIQIDTVHKFQGREKDAIIITTVDNEIGEFVDDPKLLNVAITRAKKYLRVVVSNNQKNSNTNIGDLIKYMQYNSFEIQNSKIKSIYDLLYKANDEKRKDFLKNKNVKFNFDSEKITYYMLKELLTEEKYKNLDIVCHVPLNNLIVSQEKLSDEEKKFVNNRCTHTDLIIYNTIDKQLVLVIEVDGYRYHKEGTKQKLRDNMKNKILKKYGIDLIRLNTTESGEKEIVKNKLKEILGER